MTSISYPLQPPTYNLPATTYKLKKHRGQNFLTDKNILKKIIEHACIKRTDTVVEIGAGTGNLTELLAQKAKRVIAIEIDRDLIPLLQERCAPYDNVEIVKDDARAFNPKRYTLNPKRYLVVANIPYNITSFIIRKFLEEDPQPARLLLLIQKEVAQRICAKPPHMSMLALSVQYFALPKILFPVSRNSFSPKPAVDSAVIEIVLRPSVIPSEVRSPDGALNVEQDSFFRAITAGFSSKRKLLSSNLAKSYALPREKILELFTDAEINPTARAQELSLEQWMLLTEKISNDTIYFS